MKRMRKQAFIHDGIISLVIGLLATLVIGVDGIVWSTLAVVEFSFMAFFWIVAYDPVLQIRKKKGGFVDADEMD